TKGTISNYENGHSTPSNEMLKDLADILDTTTDYLLGRTNKMASENNNEKEMMEFFSTPKLNLFFKEMAESPEEQMEELQEL
ncbi:helix-turn-helix domain-containing protein, partial [Domibacillus tundrae]|uniref:helix-turn-helix domain-containing protein n=1 Tax=Domibacillus tundrae TaxID=1587527 RepID=UPI0033989312